MTNINTNTTSDRPIAKANRETMDLLLLFALTLIGDLLTIPVISVKANERNDLVFKIDWGNSLPIEFILPLLILLFILLAIFIFRRNKTTSRKPNHVLVTVLLLVWIFRMISIFCFPYGEQTFTFISKSGPYSILYSGYSVYNRCITFLSETFFLLYLMAVYTYLPTFSDKIWKYFYVCFALIILSAFIATLYSAIHEKQYIISAWSEYIKNGFKEIPHAMYNITSFTTHRNVFGFILMMGAFSSVILTFRTKHLSFIIPIIYFQVWCMIIYTRAIFAFLTIITLACLVLYPFVFLNRKKKSSVFCLIVIGLILFSVILGFTAFRNTEIMISFRKALSLSYHNLTTLGLRQDHIELGMSMLDFPYYFLFGYNRAPFVEIYNKLEQAFLANDITWTVHNSYIQLWMDEGFLPLLATLISFLYLLYQSFYLTIKKDKGYIVFVLLFSILLLYSYIEPRMMFMKEGSSVIFIILFLLPIHHDYKKARLHQNLTYQLI